MVSRQKCSKCGKGVRWSGCLHDKCASEMNLPWNHPRRFSQMKIQKGYKSKSNLGSLSEKSSEKSGTKQQKALTKKQSRSRNKKKFNTAVPLDELKRREKQMKTYNDPEIQAIQAAPQNESVSRLLDMYQKNDDMPHSLTDASFNHNEKKVLLQLCPILKGFQNRKSFTACMSDTEGSSDHMKEACILGVTIQANGSVKTKTIFNKTKMKPTDRDLYMAELHKLTGAVLHYGSGPEKACLDLCPSIQPHDMLKLIRLSLGIKLNGQPKTESSKDFCLGMDNLAWLMNLQQEHKAYSDCLVQCKVAAYILPAVALRYLHWNLIPLSKQEAFVAATGT